MQLGKRELELVRSFASPFRIEDGRRFRLQDRDPGDTLHLDSADKPRARDGLRKGVEYLAALQDKLYAQDRWSVLLVFQAMDAAGKDSAIKHVLSGVNPQGCQVTSFKAPSAEELDHDYLWRCVKALPERGRIGIFNRSYYEEVLVARVHPEILARQKLPPRLVTGKIWKHRYEEIRDFERYLARNGTLILKFFLHVSKDEQKKRFLERLDNPDKNWKFEMGDVGRLPVGLRGGDPRDGPRPCPVVRGAGGQQVVHASGGRLRHHRRTRFAGPRLPARRRREAPRTGGGTRRPHGSRESRASTSTWWVSGKKS